MEEHMKRQVIALCTAALLLLASCGGGGTGEKNGGSWQKPMPDGGVTRAVVPEGFDKKNTQGVLANLHGLNFIDDDTPWTVVKEIDEKDKKDREAGKPYAVDVKYDDSMSLCIAIYDVVRDFDAKADGKTNDSFAIQKALLAAKEKGGGVVYIPEGVYLCENPIEIPSGVTLRGEWVSPGEAAVGSKGTVLLVKTGKGRETGTAFVTLNQGAGLRNLNILYPDQTPDAISKYPPAVQQTNGGDSYTVMNVTVAGAWIGYQGSVGWSELHYLKNVYITAFQNAIMLDTVTDIGRLEGVHLGPDYFADNSVSSLDAAGKKKISDYMFEHATGLWMKRSDWEYTYDFNAKGLNRGVVLMMNKDNRAPNAQFMKMNFENCKTAVEVQATNGIGCAFTDVTITGSEACEAGILMGNTFSTACQFDNLRIDGKIQKQISYQGKGRITVVNSRFSGWDSQNHYAVNLDSGSISIQQSAFEGNGRHISVSQKCGGTSVLGCTFQGEPDIAYPQGREAFVKIDHTPLNLPVKSGRQHVYRQSVPKAASKYVYNVEDYGAAAGTDSTQAFQKALEDAAKTGGTVYVPAGEFTISASLTIPTGVELKGIYDVPTHPITQGSVLSTSLGQGDKDGQALIYLQEGSGVNGVSFYYPQQSYTGYTPYPWTVQSLGKNCWAINTVFINSYQALDFGTNPSDGHYVSYVSGSPLVTGVFVGNNASNGWVENAQFNPHYWKRSAVSTKPSGDGNQLNNELNNTLRAFVLGDNASEHMLGNFAYAGKDVLTFVSQGGKGTNGTIIGHGSDGCRNAMVVEQADVVEMINSELVSMNSSGDMRHITMNQSVTGTVALFNSMMWAQPSVSVLVQGGTLIMNQVQYYNLEKTQRILDVTGGHAYISAMLMTPKTTQVRVTGGTAELVANLMKQDLTFVAPSGGASVKIEKVSGECRESSTWWA